MRILITLLAWVMLAGAARAQLSESDQATFIKQLHASVSLAECITRIENGKVPKKSLQAVVAILRNMHEVEIHRMRGASENKVYVSKDGKKEAVYDREGKVVKDGINDGSYNYFGEREDPLKHLTFDIAPWLLFGSSRNDPTSCQERAHAYAADVFAAIALALQAESDDSDVVLPKLDERGNVEAMALIVSAIERGKAEQIIEIVNARRKLPDRELVDIVKKFEHGLQSLFCGGDNQATNPAGIRP